MQRSFVLARGDLGVRLLRLRARDIVEERDDVVQLLVVAMEPRQIHLGQFARRHLLCLDELREVTHGPERGVLEVRRPLHRGRHAELERQLRLVDLDARNDRAEVERRRDVVRDVDRADFFIAREIGVRAVDHGLQLVLGEGQAGQLHRVGHHLERDLLRAGVLHPCPDDAGHERRAEADAREVGHEPASCVLNGGHVSISLCVESAQYRSDRNERGSRPGPFGRGGPAGRRVQQDPPYIYIRLASAGGWRRRRWSCRFRAAPNSPAAR